MKPTLALIRKLPKTDLHVRINRDKAGLLAAPYGGSGKILVESGLECDIGLVEQRAGAPQLEVIAAKR